MSEQKSSNGRISRRMLMRATGTALVGGAAASSALAQSAAKKVAPASAQRVPARSPESWLPKPVERGGDVSALAGAPTGGQHRLTSFVNTEYGLQHAKYNRQMGWAVQIKPTGYRGIPLYTVKEITVTVDGNAVDPNSIVFVMNNTSFRPSQLKDLTGSQWWVFDWATLFVPSKLEPGEHEVEVRMTYANTYSVGTATNGTKEKLTLKASPSLEDIDVLCL